MSSPAKKPQSGALDPADRHQLLDLVLSNISDGIVVADENGRFVLWNPAATRLVGIDGSEADPKTWAERFQVCRPGEDRPFPAEEIPLARAIQGEVVDECELELRHPRSGQRRRLSCSARPMRDADGALRGGVCVLRDITEQRRVEAELRSFADSIGHDLKAPLAGIIGLSQALELDRDASIDEDSRQQLHQIWSTATRMAQLIDDLLGHARLGREAERPADVDLEEVVRDVIDDLAVQISDSGAKVQVEGPLPRITGDAGALRQMLQNLLANALKFVAPGTEPRVEFGCVDAGSSWMLYVSDKGIGIPPKFHRVIFDVFRRLHGQSLFAGSGIGLATVKKVAELHHGDVRVDSTVGQGSTFWVRLPKAAAADFEAGDSSSLG